MDDFQIEQHGTQRLPDEMLLHAVNKCLAAKPINYRLLSRLMANGTLEQRLSLVHLVFLQAENLAQIRVGTRLWDEFLVGPVSLSRLEGLSDAYMVALIREDLTMELQEAARRREALGLKPFEHFG